MNLSMKNALVLVACCGVLLISGCKGKSTPYYSISVTVSGMVGSGLVLQNNNIDSLSLSKNGVATFTSQLGNNASYAVTILTPPSMPVQNCTLSNGTGLVAGANVNNITLVCAAPEFAYVANSGGNTISTLAINQATGALSYEASLTVTGSTPVALALAPTGRYAYAINAGSNSVSAYLGNVTTGLLAVAGPAVTTNINAPVAVVVDGLSKYVYVVNAGNNSLAAYSINTSGVLGSLNAVGSYQTGNSPAAMATLTNSGVEYVYVANGGDNTISSYAVIASSGALNSTGAPASTPGTPGAMVAAPNGQFVYVLNTTTATISAYAVNPANGTLTHSGTDISTAGITPVALAISPASNLIYAINSGSNTVAAFTVNGAVLSSVGVVATGNAPAAVSVDPSGTVLLVANKTDNSISAYLITPGTGVLVMPAVVTQVGYAPAALLTATN